MMRLRRKPIFVALLVCLLLMHPLFAGDPEAPDAADEDGRNELVEWRETLRYGIESQVVELLEDLASSQEEALADEVLEMLEDRTNPVLLRRGLAYFGAIEDDRAEGIARRLLESANDEDTPLEALRYLARSVETPSEETLERVRAVLNVRSERVASQAALTLGDLGDIQAIELLHEVFEQRNEESIRGNVILGIGRMGEDARHAEEWLIPLLDDPTASATVRYYTADTLGRIGSSDAREPLLELLTSDDGMMRAYAISSLVSLDPDGIGEELTRAIRDDNWQVRRIALEGIGRAGHGEVLDAVRYMARRDPDHRVRSRAVETIGELGMDDGYDFLRELLSQPSAPYESRTKAIDMLVEHDLGRSFETFASVLEAEQNRRGSRIVQYIGGALSRAEHSGLEEVYETFLSHDDVAMRLFAIQGIGRNRFTRFREQIEEFADENQPATVRRHAQEALDRL